MQSAKYVQIALSIIEARGCDENRGKDNVRNVTKGEEMGFFEREYYNLGQWGW